MTHRVLIVDDSKLARMVMTSTFRRIRPDFELIEAANATDALDAVSHSAVDMALIDFNMPGLDGLELVARIRRTSPKCLLPLSPPISRRRLFHELGNSMPPLSLNLLRTRL
jgi:CheY-like chemotaxis protein